MWNPPDTHDIEVYSELNRFPRICMWDPPDTHDIEVVAYSELHRYPRVCGVLQV